MAPNDIVTMLERNGNAPEELQALADEIVRVRSVVEDTGRIKEHNTCPSACQG